MGEVFLARQVSLGRRVALKVSKRNIASELHTTLDRLLEEALTIARLDHPTIVPVYDCIKHDSRVFIVMKYVEGFTLADLLKGDRDEFTSPPYSHFFRDGRLRREAVVEVGLRMAEALAYAHERGIHHRDIKPSNIFIDNKGKIVLIDFGIARDSSRQGLTATGVVVGTPHYMSPEQIRGVQLDGRADLYALGCVLFHCLTGRVPFFDTNEVMVCIKHLNDPVPNIEALAPDSSPALNGVVLKLLEKERDHRIASAEALIHLLEAIQTGSSASTDTARVLHEMSARISQPEVPVASITESTTETALPFSAPAGSPRSARETRTQTVKRRRGRSLRLGAIAMLILAGVLVVLAENPSLLPRHEIFEHLKPLRYENWLHPLLGVNSASGEGTRVVNSPASVNDDREMASNAEAAEDQDVVEEILDLGEEAEVIELAAIPMVPTPTPEPTPEPTPTPVPTPLPLWMTVPIPDGLAVDQSGWQPLVDWMAPRGNRYRLVRLDLLPEMELIGENVYVTLENPSDEELDVAVLATVKSSDTIAIRTPFGLEREPGRNITSHRGTPFPDSATESLVFDSNRVLIPSGGQVTIPLGLVAPMARPIIRSEVEVVSLVAVGRGAQLASNQADFAQDQDLAPFVENLISSPFKASFATARVVASPALKELIESQTRLVLPAEAENAARAEVLPHADALSNILQFLEDVESRALDGTLLPPSLLTTSRLGATINGGAELDLAIDGAPGDYRVSVVILNGMQSIRLSHRGGAVREAVRPLTGMGVFDHPVRLSHSGGTVRLPLFRWVMQDGQEAVLGSRIEIRTLLVIAYVEGSEASGPLPPRFRRIINLDASR
jgi:serine/threonine protein kinase